jgi:hypothetical protein
MVPIQRVILASLPIKTEHLIRIRSERPGFFETARESVICCRPDLHVVVGRSIQFALDSALHIATIGGATVQPEQEQDCDCRQSKAQLDRNVSRPHGWLESHGSIMAALHRLSLGTTHMPPRYATGEEEVSAKSNSDFLMIF